MVKRFQAIFIGYKIRLLKRNVLQISDENPHHFYVWIPLLTFSLHFLKYLAHAALNPLTPISNTNSPFLSP